MKEFLTDFYNKVMNFFQSEKVEGENTKETAKNRLKLVLMQDRSNLEPETMAKLREELIEVISKYIVIDKEALGLNIDGDNGSMALMLNIPVIRPKSPEEIKAALEEAQKAKEAKAEEETEEETEETAENEDNAGTTEEVEETVVEFSEGSVEELECCDCECECGCNHGEECTCAEQVEEIEEEIQAENEVEEVAVQVEQATDLTTKKNKKQNK